MCWLYTRASGIHVVSAKMCYPRSKPSSVTRKVSIRDRFYNTQRIKVLDKKMYENIFLTQRVHLIYSNLPNIFSEPFPLYFLFLCSLFFVSLFIKPIPEQPAWQRVWSMQPGVHAQGYPQEAHSNTRQSIKVYYIFFIGFKWNRSLYNWLTVLLNSLSQNALNNFTIATYHIQSCPGWRGTTV